MWLVSGALKFLSIIAEEITGKAMISASFQVFAKMCVLPFYTDIIITYFIPAAASFMFLAGLSEVIVGSLILRSRNLVKVGLALGIGMNIVFAPLGGIYTIIINIPLIIAQAWLWKRV
jgi:pyridoxal biosynthesis lyase PdxS